MSCFMSSCPLENVRECSVFVVIVAHMRCSQSLDVWTKEGREHIELVLPAIVDEKLGMATRTAVRGVNR